MSKRKIYTVLLQCNNCGTRWKEDIQYGHRLYIIKNKAVIIKELNDKPTDKLDLEDNKVICETCGCSSSINNITHKTNIFML